MPTVASVHASLAKLIGTGAYAGDRLPAERELCAVLGASRTTVRRAIARLADDGVVRRAATGRVEILRGPEAGGLRRIAFVAPAFESAGIVRWEGALRRAAAVRHPHLTIASLRFIDWEDPVLGEVKRGCDGVILLPGSQPPPERILAMLSGPGAAVASLESDFSTVGIPSLKLYTPSCVTTVLKNIDAHGHRCIGWLNTQPECPDIDDLQRAHEAWMAANHASGPIISQPVVPFEDPTPKARECMRRCLVEYPEVTAWLCSVIQTARGAIRAIHDHGWVAGRECSIATIDGEMQEDLNVPSLACVAAIDPEPYLALCLEWMLANPRRAWSSPLLLHPNTYGFHAGESLRRLVVAPA